MKLMAIRLTGADGAMCLRREEGEDEMDWEYPNQHPWNWAWPDPQGHGCDILMAVRL